MGYGYHILQGSRKRLTDIGEQLDPAATGKVYCSGLACDVLDRSRELARLERTGGERSGSESSSGDPALAMARTLCAQGWLQDGADDLWFVAPQSQQPAGRKSKAAVPAVGGTRQRQRQVPPRLLPTAPTTRAMKSSTLLLAPRRTTARYGPLSEAEQSARGI